MFSRLRSLMRRRSPKKASPRRNSPKRASPRRNNNNNNVYYNAAPSLNKMISMGYIPMPRQRSPPAALRNLMATMKRQANSARRGMRR